ncbi:GNAT family N-acetyltransferase [Ectobacillus ponti]|uniref:GNAT family N-acetyltransferase n=1 Tax=Ectobacillus ponti TaxID=2961894 RepID=A0AA42BPA7_9BACI|nr:GNAT family N-acetyltransferase [Ectobacillus ponti]MCP8968562.1 GNAT family N-acetyltransferase [Ectobacillus ponti]
MKIVELPLREAAEQIYHLQQRSYRVEAELLGFWELPPLLETAADLKCSGETFWGCYAGEALAGVLSFKQNGGELDIHRLVVDPPFFRQGVAAALLQRLACAYNDKTCVVTAAERNVPAVALYKRSGFVETGRIEPVPGLVMLRLEKYGRG